MGKIERSQQIKITTEARVLRQLRLEKKMSLREAGLAIGKCGSTIAHIESGRMAIPDKGDTLTKLLAAYGITKMKSFRQRVSKFEATLTPEEEIIELLPKLTSEKVRMIRDIVKAIAEGKSLIGVS